MLCICAVCLGVGADQTVSGLVALLAAADAVSSSFPFTRCPINIVPGHRYGCDGGNYVGLDASTWPQQSPRVVFAAFQAERFGFLGSRRFLNDLFATVCTACRQASYHHYVCM